MIETTSVLVIYRPLFWHRRVRAKSLYPHFRRQPSDRLAVSTLVRKDHERGGRNGMRGLHGKRLTDRSPLRTATALPLAPSPRTGPAQPARGLLSVRGAETSRMATC